MTTNWSWQAAGMRPATVNLPSSFRRASSLQLKCVCIQTPPRAWHTVFPFQIRGHLRGKVRDCPSHRGAFIYLPTTKVIFGLPSIFLTSIFSGFASVLILNLFHSQLILINYLPNVRAHQQSALDSISLFNHRI